MNVLQFCRILIALALGLHGSTLLAQNSVHYYHGAAFQHADAPYTTSHRVVGYFQLTVQLPPNFAIADVRPLMADFHFSDGLAARDMSDSVMCHFRVSTDAAGVVSSAEIWLRQSDTTVDEHQHSLEVYDSFEQVGFESEGTGRIDCGSYTLFPYASANGGGIWLTTGDLFSDGFESPQPEKQASEYR